MELVPMETYTDEIFVFVFAAEYWSGGGGGEVHPLLREDSRDSLSLSPFWLTRCKMAAP